MINSSPGTPDNWVADSCNGQVGCNTTRVYAFDAAATTATHVFRNRGLTMRLSPGLITVEFDIKPGSDPNSINCTNENDVIPVAILTTSDFDATTVDHTTVTFEGAGETHIDKKTGLPRRHEEDVDGDGDIDLVFHFRYGDTGMTCASTEGTLTGETFDGRPIEGTDAVRMVGG